MTDDAVSSAGAAKPARAREKTPRRTTKAAEQAAKKAILANPEFVFDDAAVMSALLEPSRPTSRKIVDLRSALVDRLERRLSRLVEAHRDVIEAAWDNLSGMEQAHQAVLALIEADSLAETAEIIETRVAEIFEVDAARLCFEAAPERDQDTLAEIQGVASLPPGFVTARIAARPRSDGSVAFSPIEASDRAIFGSEQSKLACVALVTVDAGPGWPSGLLALGSSDASRFSGGQNADLLSFLGKAAEKVLRRQLEREIGPAARQALEAP